MYIHNIEHCTLSHRLQFLPSHTHTRRFIGMFAIRQGLKDFQAIDLYNISHSARISMTLNIIYFLSVSEFILNGSEVIYVVLLSSWNYSYTHMEWEISLIRWVMVTLRNIKMLNLNDYFHDFVSVFNIMLLREIMFAIGFSSDDLFNKTSLEFYCGCSHSKWCMLFVPEEHKNYDRYK